MTFSVDFYRENRQYLPEYLSLYAMLRSHSVQLQLSPFTPESFLAAIGNLLTYLPAYLLITDIFRGCQKREFIDVGGACGAIKSVDNRFSSQWFSGILDRY